MLCFGEFSSYIWLLVEGPTDLEIRGGGSMGIGGFGGMLGTELLLLSYAACDHSCIICLVVFWLVSGNALSTHTLPVCLSVCPSVSFVRVVLYAYRTRGLWVSPF